MRWRRLFEDLEAQLEAAENADFGAEVVDRTRREASRVRTLDRLAAARGASLSVTVLAAGVVSGQLLDVGTGWLLLEEATGREVLICAANVLGVAGLGPRTGVPGAEGEVGRRLGLASAVRGVARSRTAVVIWLVDGTRWSGTIDRVGEDYLELAEHPAGEARRPGSVAAVRLVPLAGLSLLRAAD